MTTTNENELDDMLKDIFTPVYGASFDDDAVTLAKQAIEAYIATHYISKVKHVAEMSILDQEIISLNYSLGLLAGSRWKSKLNTANQNFLASLKDELWKP